MNTRITHMYAHGEQTQIVHIKDCYYTTYDSVRLGYLQYCTPHNLQQLIIADVTKNYALSQMMHTNELIVRGCDVAHNMQQFDTMNDMYAHHSKTFNKLLHEHYTRVRFLHSLHSTALLGEHVHLWSNNAQDMFAQCSVEHIDVEHVSELERLAYRMQYAQFLYCGMFLHVNPLFSQQYTMEHINTCGVRVRSFAQQYADVYFTSLISK